MSVCFRRKRYNDRVYEYVQVCQTVKGGAIHALGAGHIGPAAPTGTTRSRRADPGSAAAAADPYHADVGAHPGHPPAVGSPRATPAAAQETQGLPVE